MSDTMTGPRRLLVTCDDRHARELVDSGYVEYPVSIGIQALKLGYNLGYIDTQETELLADNAACPDDLPCPCGLAL